MIKLTILKGIYLGGIVFLFFFFQAEDGIRDVAVTGVQTCALPIWAGRTPIRAGRVDGEHRRVVTPRPRSAVRGHVMRITIRAVCCAALLVSAWPNTASGGELGAQIGRAAGRGRG